VGNQTSPSFFSRFGLWILALAVIVVFVLAFSLLFSGTTVTVKPKQRDVFIDGQFEAFRMAEVGQLAYEIMSVEKTLTKEVPATGEADVEDRASGQIIIFNNFNSGEQRLITNTRFETPDGLIYRIDKPVVVPGQKTEDGDVTPGSIEVTVYADEPGEQYNIGLTDFTIPGFEGSPRFEGFFARSKTAMTGGFVGKRLRADDEAVAKARTELRSQLEQELAEQAQAEAPAGFHLFSTATTVVFESLPQGEQSNAVEVREKATLYGVLYREGEFARFVATNTVAGYDQEPVEIFDFDMLSYNVVEQATARPWEDESAQFTLTGDAKIVWLYDEEALRDDLAGRAKDALPTILSGHPSIREAEVSLHPFWRQTFPEDIEKITVERTLE